MIEALDHYIGRLNRTRRVRRVEHRVVNEMEAGARLVGCAGSVVGCLTLDHDPGRIITCPRCGAISLRPCEGGERHPERDAAARKLVEQDPFKDRVRR